MANIIFDAASFWTLASLFLVFMIFGILGIVFIIFTPTWQYFVARTQGKDLFRMHYPDGSHKHVLGNKKKIGSTTKVNKHGIFTKTENSGSRDLKSKVTVYDSYSEFNGTLPVEWVSALNNLRSSGIAINRFDHYDKIIKHLIGEKSLDAKKDSALIIELKQKITAKDGDGKEFSISVEDYLRQNAVQVTPFKTISWHNLRFMFPFNYDPSLLDSREEAVKQAARKVFGGDKQLFYGFVISLLLFGPIAIYLITYFFGGSGSSVGSTIVSSAGGVIG